ncbi:MAG TPA: 2-C-methyl-D-erythritol 2,4-cyclodiphosphate synthase [Deltaproteobacteria bacterium]|nr:2-C-methyl-D-erythritol 2,4-cyclodiphosphate synthase [Deltaproteobacteria bacterium]
MRVGSGYDVHRLVPDRRLVLGGIVIPFNKGLLGHSDADVLIHAVIDALLGAAALGDIGYHFPDTDPEYKDISSLKLLSLTCRMVLKQKYMVTNIDCTVLAQAPKLGPYRNAMIQEIAEILNIHENQINIKFTTTEGLGEIGKGEGIGAMCVVLLNEISESD